MSARSAGSTEELELKYDVADLNAAAAWFDARFPPADEQAWQTATVTDRYVDTPAGALAAAGYGARLRRTGGRTTVGLKAEVDVKGGLHRRREIEAPATGSLQPSRWPASEARELIGRLTAKGVLEERFVIRQRRRERSIEIAGATFLVSLDDAAVIADGRPLARLRGVEIEFRSGRRRALAKLDRLLAASGLVVAQPLSKMRLAEGLASAAEPLTLDVGFAEAGRRVLARQLARMLEREEVARGGDTSALRQMRVATRRMRAAWRIFDRAFRRRDRRRFRAELRALARRLGAVRDLDALLERLPAEHEPALAPLAEAWRSQRAAAWRDLVAHLDSPAYRRFVSDYRIFVATPGAATARRLADARVGDLAGERITAAQRRVADFAPRLADADLDTLHALRIAARRLRYTLETFREVLPEAPLARLLSRLVALQDHLGALNDAHVATVHEQRWLDEQGTRADQAARTAVEAYVADRQAEITHLRRGVGRPWRGIAGPSFARDLERLLVPLDPRRGGQATQLAATPDAPFTEP